MAKASTCRELSSLSPEELDFFLASFDAVMFDCDGVLWVGNEEIEGSAKVVTWLRSMGKRIFYCTNNSTKTRQEYAKKCEKLGFGGTVDDIIGTSFLAASYLKEIGYSGKVYVVGTSGVSQELELQGFEHMGVGSLPTPEDWSIAKADQILSDLPADVKCVVCGMDYDISYMKIAKAASVINREGAIFVATNTDEQFPHKGGGILPGTGAVVRAVETAAGKKPVVMGKPSPKMFEAVRRVMPEIEPGRTIMVGDRANTDILLGKACGLQTLMVGSGVHSLSQLRAWEASNDPEENRLVADFYLDKLGDLKALADGKKKIS